MYNSNYDSKFKLADTNQKSLNSTLHLHKGGFNLNNLNHDPVKKTIEISLKSSKAKDKYLKRQAKLDKTDKTVIKDQTLYQGEDKKPWHFDDENISKQSKNISA